MWRTISLELTLKANMRRKQKQTAQIELLNYLITGLAVVLAGLAITMFVRAKIIAVPLSDEAETTAIIPAAPRAMRYSALGQGAYGTLPNVSQTRKHDYVLPAIDNGMVPVINHISTKEPVVFLTIDDGIVTNTNDTQIMEANNVKATFFLVPRFINNKSDFFAALAEETGSDIQNHTYDHYLLPNLTYDQQKEDICKNADVFARMFDRRPILFRPSGGGYNDETRRAAAECGMKALIMWNASINNGMLRSQHGTLQAGDIVLMHFRSTFKEDLEAFAKAAKTANLKPDVLVNWFQ